MRRPLGDDDAVSAAQQSRAHDSAQIVGVFDAVAQHEEGRFAFSLAAASRSSTVAYSISLAKAATPDGSRCRS